MNKEPSLWRAQSCQAIPARKKREDQGPLLTNQISSDQQQLDQLKNKYANQQTQYNQAYQQYCKS